jgi:hypothetical protein
LEDDVDDDAESVQRREYTDDVRAMDSHSKRDDDARKEEEERLLEQPLDAVVESRGKEWRLSWSRLSVTRVHDDDDANEVAPPEGTVVAPLIDWIDRSRS